MYLREYNQCAKPISGQASNLLDWIKYGQSKEYPETPSYSSPMFSRYVRCEINQVTDVVDLEDSN